LIPLDTLLADHPLRALGVVFGAGVVTSLTPCIYPMVPIVVGVLGGTGAATRSRARTIGYIGVYVLGLALVYSLLGLLAGLTGSLFGAISSNRWAYFAIGNLLLVFALTQFDVLQVPLPGRLTNWAGGLGGGSLGSAFLMGATSGLVAAPCGAPAFAAVLTFVTTTQSAVLGFLYLFVFSLGMSAVLLGVGLVTGLGAALPRAGAWTQWIKRAGGVVLLAMAEYYFIQMGKVS